MASITLSHKRAIAGIYLAALVTCALSYYLEWGLFGDADRKVLAVLTLVGVLLSTRYGKSMLQEIRQHRKQE